MIGKYFITNRYQVAFKVISVIEYEDIYEVEWLSYGTKPDIKESNKATKHFMEDCCEEVKDGNWKLAIIKQELKRV
jgi:hypothetical protein